MAGATNMPDLKTRLTLDITDFTRGLVEARGTARLFGTEIEHVTSSFRTAGVAMATLATVSMFTAGIVATSFMGAIAVLMTLGVVSAFQAASVKAAWADTGKHLREGMLDASRAYIPVLERLAVRTIATFDAVKPALTQTFDILAPVFEDLSNSFLGWLVGIIQGLPSAVNAWLGFFDSIRGAWDESTDNMRVGWDQVVAAVVSFGPQLLQEGLPPFGTFVGEVLALLAPIIEASSQFAGPLFTNLAMIADAVGNVGGDLLGDITPDLIAVANAIGELGVSLTVMVSGAGPGLSKLLQELVIYGGVLSEAFVDLAPTFAGLLMAAGNTADAFMPVIQALADDLVSFGPVAVAFANMITAMVRGFVRGIQPLLDAMGADWSGGVAVIESMTPAMERLAEAAGKFLVIVIKGIGVLMDIAAPIMAAFAMLTGLMENAGIDAGKAIMVGIITGIGFMFGPVIGVAAGIVASIAAFMPRSPAEVGPFSGDGAPEERGRRLAEQFAAGIAGSSSLVTAAASKLVGAAAMPMQPNAIGTSTMPSNLSSLLSGAAATAQSIVVNVAGSVLSEQELGGIIQKAALQKELRNAGSILATSVRG